MKIPTPKKLPSGNWNINVMYQGNRVSITKPTKKECEAIAYAIKAGMSETNVANVPLGDAIDAYLLLNNNVLAKTTIANFKSYRRTRFQSIMNSRIDKINWQQAINEEAAEVSAKTVKNAWGLISRSLLIYNIRPSVTLPKVVHEEHEWLRPDQILEFVAALNGKSFEIAALLGLHGLRRSEIYGMTWDNIDLKQSVIRVHGAYVYDEDYTFKRTDKNKTAKSRRTIPILIPRLADALASVEDKTGFLVDTNPTTLYTQVNDLCTILGFPKVGVHGLRHSLCSLGYYLGLSPMVIMRWGGWSNLSTVQNIYAHLSELEQSEATKKAQSFFTNGLQTAFPEATAPQ